ncbi:hypothetical protein ABZ611_16135 [Streptomyces sp. NPDC007861]|uniref:hypothetical protein n=1 Tax=Streptomyces sp. NPDC007861 TaxID=3154893 RepID=UPI0033E16824
MSKRKNGDGGPANSFGIPMGGTLFDTARQGVPWTVWRSVFVGLIGLAGLGVGIAYAKWELELFFGLVLFTATLWILGSVRSYRDARRLERRAARDAGE